MRARDQWKLGALCAVLLLTACPSPTPTPTPTSDVTSDRGSDASDEQPARDVTAEQPDDVPADAADDVSDDAVDVDDADDAPPDSPCLTGQMLCSGACIDVLSSAMNCGACGNACPTGATCSMGACACATGQTVCGGACVAVRSSAMHCGACGRACAAGQMCVSGVCAADCAAPRTRCGVGATAMCVDTATDTSHCGMCGNACAAGLLCTDGRCGCAMGRLSCGGACVDGNTDNANCGDCGNVCIGGTSCIEGRCVCPDFGRLCGSGAAAACVDAESNDANCGACGNVCGAGQSCLAGLCVCPEGQRLCGSGASATCVNLEVSATNCGDCGNVCPAGLVCAAGRCACPTGQTLCGSACVDVQTSGAHCGACGNACNAAQTCVRGVCACPTGQTACGGACVNAQTDAANCGMCGRACVDGQSCVAGACVCPTGQTLCGGACVDARVDRANCGTCGHACATGFACVAGVCGCPTGTTLCGSTCVNTLVDRANCGMCGRVCTSTTSCNSGACVAGAPSNDTRAGAITIDTTSASSSFLLNTSAATNNTTGPCACTSGNDVFYRFALTQSEIVYADTSGATWDTSLFLQNSAGANITSANLTGGAACNDDGGTAGCGIGNQAQIAAYLAAGTYYLVLSGCGAGEVTLRFQHLAAGNVQRAVRFSTGVNIGVSATLSGASASTGACCTSGPEVTWYAIGCPGMAALPASMHVATNSAHNLSMEQRSAGRAPVAVCMSAGGCGAAGTTLSTTIPGGAGLHTFVFDSCGVASSGPLSGGLVFGACAGGTALCDGLCHNLTTDSAHCGGCGRACTGGQTCTAGACACPTGTTLCGGTCISVTNDDFNCGACRNRCPTGQSCAAGVCRAAIQGPSFRIDSLSSVGCTAVEHAAVTGDDRSGIAVSNTQLFYTGDTTTGRFSLADLSGGTGVGRQYDALVSNLRTGQIYTFATSFTTPLGNGGTATHLIEIDGTTGALTTNSFRLSSPITMTAYTLVGIFSGYDRVGVHTGSRFYHIDLQFGTVTDLGAVPNPAHQICESFAYWGTLEYFGGALYIDYVQSSTAIARMAVPSGAITTLATFTGLGDMCAFTVQPQRNRWYFHHELGSQFRTGEETVGFCGATWSSPNETFRIGTLSNTSCQTVDGSSVTGDDRGGIVVSNSRVFYTGDTARGHFSAADLSGGAVVHSSAPRGNAIAQNLRNGAIYYFDNLNSGALINGGTAEALRPMNGDDGTLAGGYISLSRPIVMGPNTGIFSGWDRIAVHNGTHVYDIALPTGGVVDLGEMPVPSHSACEGWGYWGTVEYFGGSIYLDMVQNSLNIVRMAVPSRGATVINTLPAVPSDYPPVLADMCSFTFSPARNRWYFEHEGDSSLSGATSCSAIQTIGFCAGSYTNP